MLEYVLSFDFALQGRLWNVCLKLRILVVFLNNWSGLASQDQVDYWYIQFK